MVECLVCGGAIQPGRLEIMPDTTVCVSCTTVEKILGLMVPINGKCGMALQTIPGEDKRGQALLKKQVQRNRWNG
jgi:hypothetical protein